MNNDGNLDMISGSFEAFLNLEPEPDGTVDKPTMPSGRAASEIFIFYGNEDGTFEKKQTLARCHRHSVATPVDWDGDGDYDLITTDYQTAKREDYDTLVNLLENVGSTQKPSFSLPQPLLTGLEEQLPGKLGSTEVVDWDGDGDLDLISSTSSSGFGDIIYFERKDNADASPLFEAPRALFSFPDRQKSDDDMYEVFHLDATDYNSDGVLEILAGVNHVRFMSEDELINSLSAEDQERYRTAKKKDEERRQRVKELMSQHDLASMSQAGRGELNEKMSAINQKYQPYSMQLATEFNRARLHGVFFLFPAKQKR